MWNSLRSGDCRDESSANSPTNSFPRTCCAKRKDHDGRGPGLFNVKFGCTELICLCSKRHCCYESQTNKFKFTIKGLTEKNVWRQWWWSYVQLLRSFGNYLRVTSTNRVLSRLQHGIATYEQTKVGLSCFYPKRNVRQDGIHSLIREFNKMHQYLRMTYINCVCWHFYSLINIFKFYINNLHSIKSKQYPHCVVINCRRHN